MKANWCYAYDLKLLFLYISNMTRCYLTLLYPTHESLDLHVSLCSALHCFLSFFFLYVYDSL